MIPKYFKDTIKFLENVEIDHNFKLAIVNIFTFSKEIMSDYLVSPDDIVLKEGIYESYGNRDDMNYHGEIVRNFIYQDLNSDYEPIQDLIANLSRYYQVLIKVTQNDNMVTEEAKPEDGKDIYAAFKKFHARNKVQSGSLGFNKGSAEDLGYIRRRFPKDKWDVHMTNRYIAISHIPNPEDNNYSHYLKDVRHIDILDLYQLGEIFEVEDWSGSIHHAVKKLLAGGKRGFKGRNKDVAEAVMTLLRYLEIKGMCIQSGSKDKQLNLTFNPVLWLK